MENWCLQYGNNTEVHPISDEYGEYVIADIDPDNFFHPEKRAVMAELIANAPQTKQQRDKLLEACVKAHDLLLCLHVCDQDKNMADNLRNNLQQAIANATEE